MTPTPDVRPLLATAPPGAEVEIVQGRGLIVCRPGVCATCDEHARELYGCPRCEAWVHIDCPCRCMQEAHRA